jgi:hypothetical protein
MGNYCLSKNQDTNDLITGAENNKRLENISISKDLKIRSQIEIQFKIVINLNKDTS